MIREKIIASIKCFCVFVINKRDTIYFLHYYPDKI